MECLCIHCQQKNCPTPVACAVKTVEAFSTPPKGGPKRKKRKKVRFDPYRRRNPRKRKSRSIDSLCDAVNCMGIYTEEKQQQQKDAEKLRKREKIKQLRLREQMMEGLLWGERKKALELMKK